MHLFMQLPQQRFHSEPEMQITIFFFQGQTLAKLAERPFLSSPIIKLR